MRILIVEDEPAMGELLRELVRDGGHAPEVVPSAEAALVRLQAQRPDLILLDLRLPGMSGLDFLQLRQVRDSRVPAVVLSGVATEHDAQACLRVGALDFLAKPVVFDHLRALLERLEPHALARAVERRRMSRVRIDVPVWLREYNGDERRAASVDFSVAGMKVRSAGSTRPGRAVRLAFRPPGDTEPLEVNSLLIREDRDGYAFYFCNPTPVQVDRLTRAVRRLGALPQPA